MAGPRDETPPPSELDDVFKIVDRLPFLGSLKRDLTHLRRLLYDRRTPRVLVIGARESGRTSLANALLKMPAIPLGPSEAAPADQWIRVEASGRHLDWLEVESGTLDDGRLATVRRALDESAPDLVLVVARADRVDQDGAAAQQTLAQIRALLDDAGGRAKPPVLGVVTRVDAIAAPEATEQGGARFRTEDLGKIDAATLTLKTLLESGSPEKLRRPVPVLANGTASDGGPGSAPPLRWNVSEVAEAMHEALPDEVKVEAVRALDVPDRDPARARSHHREPLLGGGRDRRPDAGPVQRCSAAPAAPGRDGQRGRVPRGAALGQAGRARVAGQRRRDGRRGVRPALGRAAAREADPGRRDAGLGERRRAPAPSRSAAARSPTSSTARATASRTSSSRPTPPARRAERGWPSPFLIRSAAVRCCRRKSSICSRVASRCSWRPATPTACPRAREGSGYASTPIARRSPSSCPARWRRASRRTSRSSRASRCRSRASTITAPTRSKVTRSCATRARTSARSWRATGPRSRARSISRASRPASRCGCGCGRRSRSS